MADPTYYTQDFQDLRLPDSRTPQDVDKCIPRFHHTESLRDGELCLIEMVEIITPGDRLSRPVQKVTDEHRRRWPRPYAAFKAGLEPGVTGTPIATWPEMGWQIQNDLRAYGFQTIEQLAEAHDGQIGEVPHGTLWRKKAQVYLANKKTVTDKDRELEELRSRLAKLEARDVLHQSKAGDDRAAGDGAVGAVSEHAPRRGPGRPKKPAAVGSVHSHASASDAA